MRESERLKLLKSKASERLDALKRKGQEAKRIRARIDKDSFTEKLYRAGIEMPAPIYVMMIIATALIASAVCWFTLGWVVGLTAAPTISCYYCFTYLSIRAENRRRKVVSSLPGFIDVLTASLQTGYSMELSVEHATNALSNGILKREFSNVVSMLKRGIPLAEALEIIGRHIAGKEAVALTITIKMFADTGGQVLTPFRRLGLKVREQQAVLERASRDLVGIKQAFLVIFALSFTAPLFLLVNEPDYILDAFKYGGGVGYVMQVAVAVQMLCFVCFRKITALRV